MKNATPSEAIPGTLFLGRQRLAAPFGGGFIETNLFAVFAYFPATVEECMAGRARRDADGSPIVRRQLSPWLAESDARDRFAALAQ